MEIAEVFHDRRCRHLWRITSATQQEAVAETDGELRDEQRKNKISFGYRKDAGVGSRGYQENTGKL